MRQTSFRQLSEWSDKRKSFTSATPIHKYFLQSNGLENMALEIDLRVDINNKQKFSKQIKKIQMILKYIDD